MSLKFVLGTAAKDHQASLLEQIKTISQTDPQAKIYYIVPNHIKFATEVSVLDHLRKVVARTYWLLRTSKSYLFHG